MVRLMIRMTLVAALLMSASAALAQPDPTPPPPAEPPVPAEPMPLPVPPTPPSPPTVVVVQPAPEPAQPPHPKTDDEAPLSFKIGNAYITPLGFVDFTGVYRSKDGGSGIGTNFASIPTGLNFNDKLSETRLSMQNSRFGFRVDALVDDARVIGYMEADFLGNNPGNVSVSSNSNTARSRLYWVDVKKDGLELLAGQTWSLITPGKSGISPLPSDLFFTQNIDVNYQAGLVWGRIPELRLAYHAGKTFHAAIALDSPEQYIGGSAGGGKPTLPAGLATLAGTELDDGTTTLGTPNLVPDVIAKVAIDPAPMFHLEVGGVERQFKIWNPNSNANFSATGLGGFLNFAIEPVEGIRLVSSNFWSKGGGRYIFGQAPDLIVDVDGALETVTAGSTVSGVEVKLGKTLLYGYYGGIYIGQRTAPAMLGGTCTGPSDCVGYGYANGPASQNKSIQEETVGFNQTMWKNPRYGALNFMGQYSHVHRNPWSVAPGQSHDAHIQMVFFNLRYTLPGEAPKLGH